MDKLMSVVIPAFNEEAMVEKAAATVAGVLRDANIPYELIFVDDGSVDGTWQAIERAHERDIHVRGVSFSRNFGKDRAVFAGLSRVSGQCAAVMDCDLQHPAEKLPELYGLWERGYEVVEGVKADRGKESLFHKVCANGFYSVISRLAGLDMKRSSDFMVLDRKVVDTLLTLPEQEVFFRGLTAFVGFKRTELEFSVAERTAGKSKWSFKSLVRYAISSVTAFSTAPMQLATVFAVIFALAAVITGILYAVLGSAPGGWLVFLGCLGTLGVAVILACLGVAGYYIGRIYRQSLGRPRYIISRECGDIR